ncbi:MAG: hypothetical protein LBJ60_05785 [Tannerellaceae bacterium]|jgi:hypothetical protein|nr:hypothetical protein [Tannerellaceae bacterium]
MEKEEEKRMDKGVNYYYKRILNNQAIGLIPLLVAMAFDNLFAVVFGHYFSYIIAFIVGISLCLLGFIFLHLFKKENIHQFFLIPATVTLILYSVFLFFNLQPVLYNFSILIAEILLVVVLAFFGFFRRSILAGVRNSKLPARKRTLLCTDINETYFMAQITQNLYTLHLFIILMYIHLPESIHSAGVERFLYRLLPVITGVLIILYGQIRTLMIYGGLQKEVWLPVLDEKGHVIGSIARSISRLSGKKYYHPVIRIAVMYNGMLYLKKRNRDESTSPELLDYPLHQYIKRHQSMDDALGETLGALCQDKSVKPRFMIRYTFENNRDKHLVHLYTIHLQTEEQVSCFTEGKLWTPKQIKDNAGTGIFCEYFEKEFPYLQSTVLLAESLRS